MYYYFTLRSKQIRHHTGLAKNFNLQTSSSLLYNINHTSLTLSGLQSKDMIGWVDRLAFCNIETEPMTPISRSLASFFTRWSGYELNHKVIGPKSYHRCFKIITIITDHYKLDAMESPFLIHNWLGIHFLCSPIDYPLPKETKKHWAIINLKLMGVNWQLQRISKGQPTLETCIHTW